MAAVMARASFTIRAFAGTALLAAALLPLAGCKSDPVPGCNIAQATPLPPSPLTLAREGWLHRAGDAFVLVTLGGDTVRWTTLSEGGLLGPASEIKLPATRA